jgi:hypothetical protein
MALPEHAVPPETEAAASARVVESQAAGGAACAALTDAKSSFWGDTAVLWVLALFGLFLHLATASRFDFFPDELFWIIMSKHGLAGCAEEFPFQIWMTWLSMVVLGESHFAIRFLPAVAGSASILVTGLIARELGGGRFAISVAGLSVFVSPFLLFAASCSSHWSYENLLWSVSALFTVRILRTGKGRLWWLVGIAWGVALLNKPTVLLFMLGIGFGLLLTRARAEFFRRGYWSAMVLAVVLFSPGLIWQTVHGWPFLRLMVAMRSDEFAGSGFWLAYFSRSKMLLAQPAYLGPLNFILACVGLFHSFVLGKESPYRAVLWAAAAAGLAFVATSGFTYYMNPVYSTFLAFGCVAAARITAEKARWLRPVLVFGLTVQGLVIVPLCVPILSQDALVGYSRSVCRGLLAPLSAPAAVLQGSTEREKLWAMKLYSAYRTLSPDEKRNACILFGHASMAAGAEFYGAQYHLPKMYSPHLSYADWGPPGEGVGPVIAAYFSRKELEGWFGSVERAGEVGDVSYYICRSPKCTYQKMWRDMCSKDSSFRWRVDKEDKPG